MLNIVLDAADPKVDKEIIVRVSNTEGRNVDECGKQQFRCKL